MEVAALIVGIVGALAAAAALIYAHLAHADAQQALKVSKAANEFALDANRLSAESNSIAVQANEFSEKATAISERAQALNEESHDIDWDCHWEGVGRIRLTNVGQDEAINVVARVTVNGDEVEVRKRESMRCGEFIDFECPSARDQQLMYKAFITQNPGVQRHTIGAPPVPSMPVLIIGGRVTWETPLGKKDSRNLQDSSGSGFSSAVVTRINL